MSWSTRDYRELIKARAIEANRYRQCSCCKDWFFVKVHASHQVACRKAARAEAKKQEQDWLAEFRKRHGA